MRTYELKFPTLLFISIFLPLLSGCGDSTQVADGGVGGTGVTMGKVASKDTQANTLSVNEVSFDIENTSFVVEEAPPVADSSDIQVGMVVRVTGYHDGINGVAEKVEYADLLEGVVTQVTPGKNSFTVMGQVVSVDANTVYENLTDITALQINAVVEVSGFSGVDGILATRVEVKFDVWDAEELEIKGIVTSLTQSTFQIGDLTVDWSSAITPDGDPQDG